MALTINHNLMALNTARILGNNYNQLAVSTERLTSGLRINSAQDDPAGMAIRELMRSDIATLQQGIRNAADTISLLQTAEGAMGVIDEKLIRMKELAEQAATGTYSTVQREIINSEYQAMAAEIDRIANATEFNGVKLLNGSLNEAHEGRGLKVHFGLGNSEAEDYYFIKIGDLRASSQTGLRIAGDAKNDIWATTGTAGSGSAVGCCGGGIPSQDRPVEAWQGGDIFSFGYNWDWKAGQETQLTSGRYLAGAYQVDNTPTLEELVNAVNAGSQARVRIDFQSGLTLDRMLQGLVPNSAYNAANDTMDDLGNLQYIQETRLDANGSAITVTVLNPAYDSRHDTMDDGGNLKNILLYDPEGSAQRLCIGNEVYYIGHRDLVSDPATAGKQYVSLSGASVAGLDGLSNPMSAQAAHALTLAINNNPSSQFWARLEADPYREGYHSVYVFCKNGGERKDLAACDEQLGHVRGSASLRTQIMWYNDEMETSQSEGTYFNNGGKYWGTLKAVPTGLGTFGLQLDGRDVGDKRDLWILNVGSGSSIDLLTGRAGYGGVGFGYNSLGLAASSLQGLDRASFFEVQNASDGQWAGAHLRTQSSAQESLEAIQTAIEQKEKMRASLGSYQNRLENTITNLEIYAENLQAAESRISDVDIATEMTRFVKYQVLTQAGISMLSQANSLPQMALSLLNG